MLKIQYFWFSYTGNGWRWIEGRVWAANFAGFKGKNPNEKKLVSSGFSIHNCSQSWGDVSSFRTDITKVCPQLSTASRLRLRGNKLAVCMPGAVCIWNRWAVAPSPTPRFPMFRQELNFWESRMFRIKIGQRLNIFNLRTLHRCVDF